MVAFTRASRLWDGASFDSAEVFKLDAVAEPTLFEVNVDTGAVERAFGGGLFYMPHAVRADPVEPGVLWVVDVGSHTIVKFDMESNTVLQTAGVKLQPKHDATGFCKPTDVAFSTDGALAYVTDGYCNSRIVVLRRSDMAVDRVIALDRFQVPHSIAVACCGSRDVLWVCNREAGSVVVVDAATGALRGTVRAWASEQLPYGVSLASRGRVVVGLANHGGIGALWTSDDGVACADGAPGSSVKGVTRAISDMVQPHLMHVLGESLLVAEANDGKLRGALWHVNL